jgi:hypothetical protein
VLEGGSAVEGFAWSVRLGLGLGLGLELLGLRCWAGDLWAIAAWAGWRVRHTWARQRGCCSWCGAVVVVVVVVLLGGFFERSCGFASGRRGGVDNFEAL